MFVKEYPDRKKKEKKVLAIPSITTNRRSAVCQEDLKPYKISEKRHIFLTNQKIYYLQLFKDFTNHRKKTKVVIFCCRPLSIFLNDESFQWSRKLDFFRHVLKSPASLYESSAGVYGSSGSQFFRTTTGIQSRLDIFDESRLDMTFLTNLELQE